MRWNEVTESTIRSRLEAAIATGFARYFQAESATPGAMTETERALAQDLLATRYASPAIPPRRRRSAT